jgi:hypothetical protein
MCTGSACRAVWLRATHAVDQVEDEPHGHAELLKVELAVIVHVGQVPHALQLVVPQMRVLEDGRCLGAIEEGAALRQRAEDLPVLLDLVLLYAIGRHCGRGKRGKAAGCTVGGYEPRVWRRAGAVAVAASRGRGAWTTHEAWTRSCCLAPLELPRLQLSHML